MFVSLYQDLHFTVADTAFYRHITISINARLGSTDQDLLNVDVGQEMTIADLKAVIHADTGVPPSEQALFFNTIQLQDETKTLDHYQICEDSMLGLLVQPSYGGPESANRGPEGRSASDAESPNPPRRGGLQDAESVRLQALGNGTLLNNLRYHHPELFRAINDPERFRQIWEYSIRYQNNIEAEKHRELAILNADPFNIETQMKIEEIIRQEQVMENVQSAMDYTPEVFGKVHMLYIPVEVNATKIKAFVDSGAQATIMSPECAEACGIMRLIDKRYAGIARGVGTAKVLGRVHFAQIKIGDLFLPCSFTVMEGKEVDLLLGLDMLKRHQACIDLNKNALVIQGQEIAFLPEGEIPKDSPRSADEPKILGPQGMETGAISGAISKSSAAGQSSSQIKAFPKTPSFSSTPLPQQQQHRQQPQDTSTSSGNAPATGDSQFPSADIARLEEMGLTREQAIHSLEAAGGNVLAAASMFFN